MSATSALRQVTSYPGYTDHWTFNRHHRTRGSAAFPFEIASGKRILGSSPASRCSGLIGEEAVSWATICHGSSSMEPTRTHYIKLLIWRPLAKHPTPMIWAPCERLGQEPFSNPRGVGSSRRIHRLW